MTSIRYARALLGLICLSCGSSSSSSSTAAGSDAGGGNNGHFTITTSSAGSFTCQGLTQSFEWKGGSVLDGQVDVICTHTTPGSNATTTDVTVSVAVYHGTDTYTFAGMDPNPTGSPAPSSTMMLTIGNVFVSPIGHNTVTPPTSCTVKLSGPSPLNVGDEAQGTFHCDNLAGAPGVGATPTTYGISADGDFAGVAKM